MSADLIAWLFEATIATAVAVCVVLAMRYPVRAAGGAGAAYALWALVPVAAVAVLLPATALPALPAPTLLPMLPAAPSAAFEVASGERFPTVQSIVLTAWLAGALFLAMHLRRSQRRFVASLGP